MRKCECKSEIYMTTKLTVATTSEKLRVTFYKLFFSETNSENRKDVLRFTAYDLRLFDEKGPISDYYNHTRFGLKWI